MMMVMMMMMMMMMMINCFCGMVDRRKAFSLISSLDHCQRSSPPAHFASRVWTCAEPEFSALNRTFMGKIRKFCHFSLENSITSEYSSGKSLTAKNFGHQVKISSFFPSEVFPVPLNIFLILPINYFKLLTNI